MYRSRLCIPMYFCLYAYNFYNPYVTFLSELVTVSQTILPMVSSVNIWFIKLVHKLQDSNRIKDFNLGSLQIGNKLIQYCSTLWCDPLNFIRMVANIVGNSKYIKGVTFSCSWIYITIYLFLHICKSYTTHLSKIY